jgi:alanine dehydrogenase
VLDDRVGKRVEERRGMNLDENAVGRLLRVEEVIPAMEGALADFSSRRVVQPTRVMVPVTEHEGFLGLMPAYTGAALGTKLVAFYPRNTEVPTHHATILLFKPETGEALVTMDGRLITEVRTAAVSAVATERLARSDASVLAIIGSGVQARSHLEALRLVREFREVRVWSPRRARAFAEEHGVRASASAEEAVRGADVVVTATTSPAPVLSGEWLLPGAHVNAVGAPRPDWRELDDEVLRRSRVYVDSREAAMKESGDVIAAGEIFAEVGEVVSGAKPGRQSDEEVTLFKSLGLAVEDVATAELVHRKALEELTAEESSAQPAPRDRRPALPPRQAARS